MRQQTRRPTRERAVQLAFDWEEAGEARPEPSEGSHPRAAPSRAGALAQTLMEEVVAAANLRRALKRVQANKGSPGVDGMTVQELPAYLKEAWPRLRQELLEGTLSTTAGEAGGDPEAGRRGAGVGHPDGSGSVHPAGDPAGVDSGVRPDVLAIELRVPPRQERPPGAGGGAGARREREGLGGGPRPGEVLGAIVTLPPWCR